MRLPAPVRAVGWRTGRRAVDWSAKQLKLASYVPMYDYREQLDANTTLTVDAGETYDITAGTTVVEQPRSEHAAENAGDVPVNIVLATLFEDGSEPAILVAEPSPAASPAA